jgi:excisionase family DNA binding protein
MEKVVLSEASEQINTSDIKLLNADQAAQHLSLSKSTLYKICSRKVIPYYQPGGKKIYFLVTDLNKYILSKRIATADELREEAYGASDETEKYSTTFHRHNRKTANRKAQSV